MPASLYLHIPFCLKRCVYCDFVSGIYDPEKADEYIAALKKELIAIPRGYPFSTLFIGGGTPTALSADALGELITHIFNNFSFTDDYEATIEANPCTLSKEKLTVIRKAGMNRISVGIQSFNDDELMLLGRLHSSSDAVRAVHLARDAGFKNIGIDLMYGMPGQGMKSWEETIERAVELKPEHISAYELTVEKGTVLHAKYQEGILKSLDDDLIVEMYNRAIDYLAYEGYSHYEISNFAIPGYSCIHNLTYWDRGEYYGIGLGAHSFVSQNRFYNTDNLEDYFKALSESRSPLQDEEYITGEMALSEAIFLGLRKIEGINVESFFKRYGLNILSNYQDKLEDMKEKGLIEIANPGCSYASSLKLTRRGLLLSNEIFEHFI